MVLLIRESAVLVAWLVLESSFTSIIRKYRGLKKFMIRWECAQEVRD